MVDYLEGADHCKTNSNRLQTTARIILKNPDGTDPFALFLYYIAYEEIAKAIFCLFVHKRYVSEEFINGVFVTHQPKIALFEEFFRSFSFESGVCYLGGKKLGDMPLADFIKNHVKKIKKHRRETMDFLYVDKGDPWKIPLVELPDIDKREKYIQSKIHALDLIFDVVKNHLQNVGTMVNNFQFFENPDGSFTIQYDEI